MNRKTNSVHLAPSTTGFFVDWNGDTRRVERPGRGYTCAMRNASLEGKPYQAVDVIDSEGFVTHEAVYYASLKALKAVGVTINLIEEAASLEVPTGSSEAYAAGWRYADWWLSTEGSPSADSPDGWPDEKYAGWWDRLALAKRLVDAAAAA